MCLVSSDDQNGTRPVPLIFDTAVQAIPFIRVRAVFPCPHAKLGSSESTHWSYTKACEARIAVPMTRSELNLMQVSLDFERVEPVERYVRMEIPVRLLQGNSG